MNYSLTHPRELNINDLHIRTNVQQRDLILLIIFFLLRYGTLEMYKILINIIKVIELVEYLNYYYNNIEIQKT